MTIWASRRITSRLPLFASWARTTKPIRNTLPKQRWRRLSRWGWPCGRAARSLSLGGAVGISHLLGCSPANNRVVLSTPIADIVTDRHRGAQKFQGFGRGSTVAFSAANGWRQLGSEFAPARDVRFAGRGIVSRATATSGWGISLIETTGGNDMRILLFFAAGAMLLIATACGRTTQVSAAPKPLEVLVADVQQKDVPIYREWIGTVDGLRQRGDQSPGNRLSRETGIHRGLVRPPGTTAFPDRSAAVSGRPRSGRRAACAIARDSWRRRARNSRRRRRKSLSPRQISIGFNWMWTAIRRFSSSTRSPNRTLITPLKTTWQRRRSCRRQERRWRRTRPRLLRRRLRCSPPRPQLKRRASISDSRG